MPAKSTKVILPLVRGRAAAQRRQRLAVGDSPRRELQLVLKSRAAATAIRLSRQEEDFPAPRLMKVRRRQAITPAA